jgi:CRP-like cAMP-binding protein
MSDNNGAKAQIANILQKLPVFAGLTADEFEHIRRICVPVKQEDGETLFVEGDHSPCMFVLLSGEVQLRTSKQGKIHTVTAGELLGEIGMIAQQARTATAIASAPSVLLQIDSHAFEDLLNRAPRICFKIMRNVTRIMSGHLVRMTQAGTDNLDYLPFD